jgi:hypothetical protein
MTREVAHTTFLTRLIASLKTEQVMNDKRSLDKEETSYNDILNSFRHRAKYGNNSVVVLGIPRDE